MPTVPTSVSAGAIITVAGLTGNIRGRQHTQTDGTVLRPSPVTRAFRPEVGKPARAPGNSLRQACLPEADEPELLTTRRPPSGRASERECSTLMGLWSAASLRRFH